MSPAYATANDYVVFTLAPGQPDSEVAFVMGAEHGYQTALFPESPFVFILGVALGFVQSVDKEQHGRLF